MWVRWSRPVKDQLSRTHIRVCGRNEVCRATQMVAKDVSSMPSTLTWWGRSAPWWRARMGTGSESHGTTFLLLGNTLWMYLSMNELPIWKSTAKFSNKQNQTRTFESPSCTKKKIVSLSETGFFAAVRRRGDCTFLMFESHSLYNIALFTKLSPASVLRRHVCGWRCWALVHVLRLPCMLTRREEI